MPTLFRLTLGLLCILTMPVSVVIWAALKLGGGDMPVPDGCEPEQPELEVVKTP